MPRTRREPTCDEIRQALKEYETSEGAIDRPLFDRLGARIRQQGYVGPDDLYLIAFWKSTPAGALKHARGALLENTPSEIEDISRRALEPVAKDDTADAAAKAVEELDKLHHVGIPIASAILAFCNPDRFGAIDPNAWKALGWPDDDSDWEPGDYGRYVIRIRELARKCGLTPREVDSALYWIGSPS